MRQLFVDFDKSPETHAEGVAFLSHAFRDEDRVDVRGTHENVEVAFTLTVDSVASRRRDGRQILEFSGVTEPEHIPYIADYDGNLPEKQVHLELYNEETNS